MYFVSMWTRITTYSLFVLGLLTVTFFRSYSGEIIPHPLLFWLLGLGMFLAGFLLLRYTPSRKDQTALRQLRQLIGDLKANGERITVDFEHCELREQSYRERKQIPGSDSLLLDLTGPERLNALLNYLEDETQGTGMVNVCQTVLIFSYSNARTALVERFVSQVVSKDRVSLSFYLDQQRQTTLYVDKADRSLYYFDLDFLRS